MWGYFFGKERKGNILVERKYYKGEQSGLNESDLVEFKAGFNLDNALKDIIAFFNTNGGVIYFGIDDNGIVNGVDCDNLDLIDRKIFSFLQNIFSINDIYTVNYHQVSFSQVALDKYIIILTLSKTDKEISDKSGNVHYRTGTSSPVKYINKNIKDVNQLNNEIQRLNSIIVNLKKENKTLREKFSKNISDIISFVNNVSDK